MSAIAFAIALPVFAADPLQAVLSIKLKEPGKEVPPRLVQEITNHVTRQIRDAEVLASTPRGTGRLSMTVALPPEERLKFEKMVVELPTAPFSSPVQVESWNIVRDDGAPDGHRLPGASVGPSADTTAPLPDVHFAIETGTAGELAYVKLVEVPVKDVLAHLARSAHLQYVCPDEIASRMVCAELRGTTVEDLLKTLKVALGVELTHTGAVWVFSNKEMK